MNQKVEEGKPKLVPPDGGWGWVICFAYALNNVMVLPIISGFGLIFQDTFDSLNISGTGTTVIIAVHHAFGMMLSLFNGPILSRFGFRKGAVVGGILVSLGILLSSAATRFIHFLITYSLMTSIGVALVMSSYSLAINTYFVQKRSKAMGIGMSITGIGLIVMPQIINALMENFGKRGAMMILAAFSMHSIVAALLLRPVKWYMKVPEDPEICDNKNDDVKEIEMKTIKQSIEYLSENEEDYLDNNIGNDSVSGKSPKKKNTEDITNKNEHVKSCSNPNLRTETEESKGMYKWWKSVSTEINLASSLNLFMDEKLESMENLKKDINKENLKNGQLKDSSFETDELIDKGKTSSDNLDKKSDKKSLTRRIIEFFDFDLLRDPIFVNIMLGISIAACAEINFSQLTPFILKDLDFNTSQIAAVLSVIATSDIIFRFISPFIGDWCKKSPRVMYLMSLLMLIFTRTTIFFASTYQAMLLVGVGLGIAKGVRTVYVSLILPNYVPIDRLPYATGIQMLTNGIIIFMIGPILGIIRDNSGSYNISILIVNIVTFITLIMWTGEYIYVWRIYKRNNIKT